jgi:hypothetical protein
MSEPKKVTLQEIVDILKDGTHEIEFTKLDGAWRQLHATLDPVFTLKDEIEELDASKVKALAVMEAQMNEWRSFRLDRLIAIDNVKMTYAGE